MFVDVARTIHPIIPCLHRKLPAMDSVSPESDSFSPSPAALARGSTGSDDQGLTLFHSSAQLERFLWDKGVRAVVV